MSFKSTEFNRMVSEKDPSVGNRGNLYERNKLFLIVLFLAMFIRIFIFSSTLVIDTEYFVAASELLTNGINPYETNTEFFCKYPPLFYYLISFFGLVSNFSYLGPKLMVLCFEFGNIVIIYKIGILLKNRNLGLNISVLYGFNPLIIDLVMHDVNEFVTLFFTLLSIYYLLNNKVIYSSIFLALGIGFKLYPVFFLIPITLYLYKNSNDNKSGFTQIISYLISLITVIFLIFLPFLLISPNSFIQCFLIHTSRQNLGYSLLEIIPELEYFYNTSIRIFGINFSYQFIIQITIFVLIFLILYVYKKNFTINDLFITMVIITVLLSLITYQIQYKYTNLMTFPFLLFLFYKNRSNVKENEIFFRFFLNFFTLFLYLLVYIIFFPPIDNLLLNDMMNQRALIYTIFWLINFSLFIIYEIKIKRNGEYKIHLLNFLPVLTFLLIPNIIGGIIVIILLIWNIIYIFNKFWRK